MAAALDQAIQSLIEVFKTYTSRNGRRDTLSESEFKDLIRNELSFGAKMSDAEIQRLMSELDLNEDKRLSFKEYMNGVGRFAIIIYKGLTGH